jgi:hypothetical protein
MEEYLCQLSNRRLTSSICKELKNLNTRKTSAPMNKWVKEQFLSKEEVQMVKKT